MKLFSQILYLVSSLLIQIVVGSYLLSYLFFSATPLDYSYQLSNKVETIEVNYIQWACPCANWLPTTFDRDAPIPESGYDMDPMADACIFLERGTGIPISMEPWIENGNSGTYRLTGSYYSDQGISRDYESPVSAKPDHSRVFRYTSWEYLGSQ